MQLRSPTWKPRHRPTIKIRKMPHSAAKPSAFEFHSDFRGPAHACTLPAVISSSGQGLLSCRALSRCLQHRSIPQGQAAPPWREGWHLRNLWGCQDDVGQHVPLRSFCRSSGSVSRGSSAAWWQPFIESQDHLLHLHSNSLELLRRAVAGECLLDRPRNRAHQDILHPHNSPSPRSTTAQRDKFKLAGLREDSCPRNS